MAYETRKSFLEHPALTHSCRALAAGIVIAGSVVTLINLSAPVATVGGILLLTGKVSLAVSALAGGMLELIAQIGVLIDWLDKNGDQFSERDIAAINALTDMMMDPAEVILVWVDENLGDIGNPKIDAEIIDLRQSIKEYIAAKTPVEKAIRGLEMLKDVTELLIESVKALAADPLRKGEGHVDERDGALKEFERWNKESKKTYRFPDRDPRNIA